MTAGPSLAELLADPRSSAPAIIATSPLMLVSYKALAEQIDRLSGQLSNAGLKELINRGGEKISPEEVEAVLLEHPAVAEAAVFGIPDARYGEDVSAAVVLRGPASTQELQAFCSTRLADFKVPRLIHMVSAIAKNAMGKVQRGELRALFS
jgi:acyl-CoA synthetase (AMP-forming)/AMP-acid ligase II